MMPTMNIGKFLQMAKLRRLDRNREKAIMCNDREKVKRMQQRIRKLKREIENNA